MLKSLLAVTIMSFALGRAGADEQMCQRVFYTLLDLSGSYEAYRAKALEDLKRLVANLRASDCFILKSIGQESWSDKNTLLVLRLPVSSRPIDPGHQRMLMKMKTQAISRLEALKAAPKAPYTDFWCSVFAASQAIQNSAAEKHLLSYTDLLDNRRRKECQQIRLEGVSVTVSLIPHGNDPAAFDKRIGMWAKVFKDAGASQVQFFDTDGLAVGVER
jgi:hypothetical protein